MPTRLLNWDVALAEWVTAQLGRSFVWGETDCGSLIRGAYAQMYGEDPYPEMIYDSEAGALAELTLNGGVRDRLLLLGAEPLVLPFCTTGDIVVATREPRDSFDYCLLVVGAELVLTEPGGVVSMIPLWQAPEQATGYRLPHAW